MGMPGRGVMFVGDKGVLVSAFYGGSPWLPDHILPQPGQKLRGLPGGQLLPESRFKDFKQPEPNLPRCERPDHYAEWIRACKAGKKSITPMEFACDLTEFALLGTATLRRYSTPGAAQRERAMGRPADRTPRWCGFPRPATAMCMSPTRAPPTHTAREPCYWRSSKVLLWDSKAMRFTNDEVANGYVDMPYRKEWDYKV